MARRRGYPPLMRPLCLLVLLLGCPDPDTGKDTAGGDDTGGGVPSQDWCGVIEIFNDECVVCHSASGKAGDLDLETDPYAAIVGIASAAYAGETLVVAGDAEGSFLLAKMAGTQGANGEVMPTSGALDAALVDVVRTWIDAGATDVCDNPDTGGGDYHPAGWAEPGAHGMAAKFQEDDCLGCHGADLTGGDVGVSCDECHAEGWRTDCTYCHGGGDNGTGAPPEDIDDQSTALSFAPHTAHVEDTDLHDAFACLQCHRTPDEALSTGHFLVGDDSPGVAETDLGDGLASRAEWNGTGCSNNYCHGDGTGHNGSVDATDSVGGCNDCHDASGNGRHLSGRHEDHLEEGVSCTDCHGDTVSSATRIEDPSLHVDGEVQVTLPAGMTRAGNECTGACHGENHRGEDW